MSAMYCEKCGKQVYESTVTVARQLKGNSAEVVEPSIPLNQPCGHRAPVRTTSESVTYPARYDGSESS